MDPGAHSDPDADSGRWSSISPRGERVVVAALLGLFLLADLLAVFSDTRLSATDTMINEALALHQLVQEDAGSLWLSQPHDKGPLPTLTVYLLYQAMGDPLWAARLLNVGLHLTLLLLVWRLVLRHSGSRAAALLALVVCGTTPAIYGWFRLAFHEPMVSVFVLLTLDRLTRPLRRPRDAVWLGLCVAGGLMSKLSFPLFVLLPGLWFLATGVRDRRALLLLGGALATCLVAVAWWLVPSRSLIVELFFRSSQVEESTCLHKLPLYTLELSGAAALFGAGVAGGILTWLRRPALRGVVFVLLGCALGGLGLLVFVFDPWSRYVVPALPAAAVLAGLGAAVALEPARRRALARIAGLLLAVPLLAHFIYTNVRAPAPGEREFSSGMVSADRRPHTAYPAAVAQLRRGGHAALPLTLIAPADLRPGVARWVWGARGFALRALSLDAARRTLARGEPIWLLVTHPRGPGLDLINRALRTRRELPDQPVLDLLRGHPLLIEQTTCDPDDLCRSIARVGVRR